MATWFAQNSSVNIDSVNQWNDAAGGGGSWLTWASLAVGDILVANGKTSITINVNVTCATLTTVATGGTAGGGFLLAAGVTVTANVVAGTTVCINRTASGTASTVIGNCTGGASASASAITNASTATMNVTGTVTGGSGNAAFGVSAGSGNLVLTGNVLGGSSGSGGRGLGILGAGVSVTITGNVTGGSVAAGIYITGSSAISITGNVCAGSGATGIEIAGTLTTPIIIIGDMQSTTAHPSVYSAAFGAPVLHSGTVTTVTNGREIAGYVTYRIHPTAAMTFQHRTYNTSTNGDLGSRSLYTGGISIGHPATTDVRSGTTFGAASEYTGTLAVPSPTLVAIGVATDNTVGSYAPTGGLDAAGVRTAIGLASANLDTQLSGIQSDTNDIQTRLPAALESGRIAAALDSAATAALVDLIWDEPLTKATHNVATSSGKRLRQTTAFQQIDATVNDASASTTTFITDLTSSVDNFYNDSMLVFTDGALAGQVRAIYDYIGATKTIVLEEALTSAPVNGVAFTIVSLHIHPVSQIQSGLATAAALATESTKLTAIETFATRVTTGLVADGAVYQFTANMLELAPSGTGGDATLAKQNDILAAIQGAEVIQVASPNVLGNLVLTQGDDYDGVANPKASWTVTTDYTTGWTVRLTIRDSGDAVVYTNTGSVVSATVVAVTIAAPTGLTMTGCPGQWQGKFDVELTHSSGKKKTIAIGTCYINEDQTR